MFDNNVVPLVIFVVFFIMIFPFLVYRRFTRLVYSSNTF